MRRLSASQERARTGLSAGGVGCRTPRVDGSLPRDLDVSVDFTEGDGTGDVFNLRKAAARRRPDRRTIPVPRLVGHLPGAVRAVHLIHYAKR